MRAHGSSEPWFRDGSREESLARLRARGVPSGRGRPLPGGRPGGGGCRGLKGRLFGRLWPRLRWMDLLHFLRLRLDAWGRRAFIRLETVGPPGRSERARRGMPDRPGPGGQSRTPWASRGRRGGRRGRAERYRDPEQGSHARLEGPWKEPPEQGATGGSCVAILCPIAPIARHTLVVLPVDCANMCLRVLACVCLQVGGRKCQVNRTTPAPKGDELRT